MTRPTHRRRIDAPPPFAVFKPAGVPKRELTEVCLTVDEYEALRLADFEGMYQEAVAERMGVSRQTVGRILQVARGKVAEALVHGKALRIEGGVYVTESMRQFACASCGHAWDLPFGGGRPAGCPACGADDIHRMNPGRRGKQGRKGRHGRGCGRES